MNLTESYTSESFCVETFINGNWGLYIEYKSRPEAEASLARLLESNPKWTQARIVHKIVKTTTDKWLLKQIEL